MAQTKTDRLVALSMVPELAKEVTDQINAAASGGSVAWTDVTGKPATFTPTVGTTASTALAGNTALLSIGTTSTTAKAGNYVPAWGDVTGKPATFPATVPVATATALATGRTISLTGPITGTSAAFTGASNATIATTLAAPSGSVRGGVLIAAAQADSAATDVAGLVTDFNALLAKLRTAGVIAA